MSDIFREVDEDLRRERMESLWKRYGAIAVAGALALVAAVGGYTAWRNWQETERREETAALVAALEQGRAQDSGAAAGALAQVAAGADAGIAALARLNAAAAMAGQGRADEAAEVYDALAADAGAPAPYRDLATLLSVMQRLETGDPAALRKRLEPLAGAASPWRFSARELSALLARRAGERDTAIDLLKQLADDPEAPTGVRSRAADLAALYGRT